MREKLGRPVVWFVSSENYIIFIAFERHLTSFATGPSERGGRQERRKGPLNEAGCTEGRSKAKDCAAVGIVDHPRP
jgi:hypothetical protein